MLRLLLPRLHGCEAGRTELGGLHHHGRRMIFTGGKRSSAVLAACEKRRSGLAPKTTQGPGTKTESSIFGMPNQQVRRAASLSASGRVDGAACAQVYSGGAGAGLRPASRPPIWLVKNRKKIDFLFSLISVLGRWVGVQIVVLSELDGKW